MRLFIDKTWWWRVILTLQILIVIFHSGFTDKSFTFFTLDALAVMSTVNNEKNMVISQNALKFAMCLLYMGARGKTELQLNRVLELSDVSKPLLAKLVQAYMIDAQHLGVEAKYANHLYVSKHIPINPKFLEYARNFFYTPTDEIDFGNPEEAANLINQYQREQTQQKYNILLRANDIPRECGMIMISGLSIKASWQHKFPVGATKKGIFFTPWRMELTRYMIQEGTFKFSKFSLLPLKAVELPLKDVPLSMIILLPKSIFGLQDVLDRITDVEFNRLLSDMTYKNVSLKLPKFKFESSISLNIPRFQMSTLYTKEANFQDLTSKKGAHLCKALHKNLIEVNERGVNKNDGDDGEVKKQKHGLRRKEIFIVNRPFAFIIRHGSTIYFSGTSKYPTFD